MERELMGCDRGGKLNFHVGSVLVYVSELLFDNTLFGKEGSGPMMYARVRCA